MRCTVLVENSSSNPEMLCEHGLSLLIETQKHTILFDMGQTNLFADNAEKMGVDLSKVDFAVISHGHYDHGGGIRKFFEINQQALVYVHKDAFLSYMHGDRSIGLDSALVNHPRIHLIHESVVIDKNVSIVTCGMKTPLVPVESYGLTVKQGNGHVPDLFQHEIALLIKEQKTICISGCSHRGILNYVHWFNPDVLIGGFHLKKIDPDLEKHRLQQLGEELLRSSAVFYTGHCTGERQFQILKEIMNCKLHAFSTGSVFEIKEKDNERTIEETA